MIEIRVVTGQMGEAGPDYRAAFDRGLARWPDVQLEFEGFCSHLSSLEASAENVQRQAEDLYLVAACVASDTRAIAHLEAEYISKLRPFLGRFRPSDDFCQEVEQRVRERLLVGPSPRLARYSGSGPLLAWLRVFVIRIAIDLSEAEKPWLGLDDPIAERILTSAAPTAEAQLVTARYRTVVQTAFEHAFERLSVMDRTLLRLQFIDSLGIDRLATIYHVHRSTIARRLNSIQAGLVKAMSAEICAVTGMTPSEFASAYPLFRSELRVSISRLLAAG